MYLIGSSRKSVKSVVDNRLFVATNLDKSSKRDLTS